jgi:hypothetical protein
MDSNPAQPFPSNKKAPLGAFLLRLASQGARSLVAHNFSAIDSITFKNCFPHDIGEAASKSLIAHSV